ncbi:MAG: flavodoxin family protein [Lachnospiraceae bacterium]|nr:flavodoxin family protein [Lachnospiraceae bacterium]
MKCIIVTASVHHGNTKKIVDAIAKEFDVDIVDATSVKEKDLTEYDLIGFASGVYGFNLHKAIIEFATKNLPDNKKIFLISTSAMNKDFSQSFMDAIATKNPTVAGKFSCHGYNTFGPFKLVGGTSKGHPDEKDIANAIDFYKEMIKY